MIDGEALELLKNENMHVGRVQFMAIWNTAREDIPQVVPKKINKFGEE